MCSLTFFEVKQSHLPRVGFGQRLWCFQLSVANIEELVFHKQLLDGRVPCQGAVRFQRQAHNRDGHGGVLASSLLGKICDGFSVAVNRGLGMRLLCSKTCLLCYAAIHVPIMLSSLPIMFPLCPVFFK